MGEKHGCRERGMGGEGGRHYNDNGNNGNSIDNNASSNNDDSNTSSNNDNNDNDINGDNTNENSNNASAALVGGEMRPAPGRLGGGTASKKARPANDIYFYVYVYIYIYTYICIEREIDR